MEEIHYLLGNSCNLNCRFCFWDLREEDISFDKKKQIIDEIVKVKIKKVTISGGEPTCNKDLIPVLQYANRKGLEVILHTNGLKINKDLALRLKPLVSRISLSLDSADEDEAEKMRECGKTFSHTVWLIDTLCKLKISVNVKTLVTKINFRNISKIGEIVSRYPVEYWSLLEFNPINRGKINEKQFNIPSKNFDRCVEEAKYRFPEMKVKIRKFVREPEKYCFIASDGRVYKYIKGKGDLLVGNVFTEGLKKILPLV